MLIKYLVIILIICVCTYTEWERREMLLGRPFLHVYDQDGNKTNIVFITHPFSAPDHEPLYWRSVHKGYQFLGISSYIDFPGIIGDRKISNPHDIMSDPDHLAWKYDYFKLVRGWCHCFRNPDKYIPARFPKLLLSESDFSNQGESTANEKKEYDFIYICLVDNDKCTDGWQAHNRNWTLAQQCLDIMCNKFKLKGLLIGRVNCTLPKGCHTLMDTTGFLDYHNFVQQYARARFIFCPNIYDASPRVLTEALTRDLPGLVNHNILGGWKYITEESGETFTGMQDFEDKLGLLLKKMKDGRYHPRQYYTTNYGREFQGKELLSFVKSVVPEKDQCKHTRNARLLYPGV